MIIVLVQPVFTVFSSFIILTAFMLQQVSIKEDMNCVSIFIGNKFYKCIVEYGASCKAR